MPEYVIVDSNDNIVNVIIAESKEAAEELTGLTAIEAVNQEPWIGWVKVDGVWVNPNPIIPPDYSVQVPSVPEE